MVDRDERRWKRADKDMDGALSKEEFMDFLHPEEADNMKDIVVEVGSAPIGGRQYEVHCSSRFYTQRR